MSLSCANSCKMCLTSVNDFALAQQIARDLLQQKLVACVNISSKALSMYYWQGDIVEENEYILSMKTSAKKVATLSEKLILMHPYDVPEFIVIDIKEGAPDYINWINSVLS